MIEAIAFRNFKALRDAEVPLSRVTLVVGPNCSGKTSILQGLYYISQVTTESPDHVFCGEDAPECIGTSGSAGSILLGVRGTSDSTPWGVALEFKRKSEGHTGPVSSVKLRQHWGLDERDQEGPVDHFGSIHVDSRLVNVVQPAALLHFDPRRLAEPSYSTDISPSVEFDGANLAATLADMAIVVPQDYQELLQRFHEVVPPITSLRLQKTSINGEEYEQVMESGEPLYRLVKTRTIGYQVVLDFTTGEGLMAGQASEGTLLTLGLLTVLSAPSRPRLVLIDELERGLHPKALGHLVQQMRDIQQRFPDLQIVGTTHSPYLVDHFDASEVVLTALREDGSVAVGRLSDHPEFDRWKDEMKPGEFWSTVGEDWVRDAKTPP